MAGTLEEKPARHGLKEQQRQVTTENTERTEKGLLNKSFLPFSVRSVFSVVNRSCCLCVLWALA
jgi:hypothetical protein